jgi:hypothetical protein
MRIISLAWLLVLAGALAGPVKATPLVLDGDWVLFNWQDGPDVWHSGEPFTFAHAGWTSLKVTDSRVTGDRFDVYDGDALLGRTSPRYDGWDYMDPGDVEPDAYYEDPKWSSGEFVLPPGTHAIRIWVVDTAPLEIPPGHVTNVDGEGYLRIDRTDPRVIPVPGSVLLAALGAGVVALVRRRSPA